MQSEGGVQSASAVLPSRKVLNRQIGRYVFTPFGEQLKLKLQDGIGESVVGTSTLDLIEQRRRSLGLRERAVKWDGSEDDNVAAANGDSLESSFSVLLAHKATVIKGKGGARELIEEIRPTCTTIPMLLLNRNQIVDLLIANVRIADSYELVLDLLPAIAKDLRHCFLPCMEQVVQGLHLLLFDFELSQNGDGVQKVFKCLAHICKYLCRPLATQFHRFLELMVPLVLHRSPEVFSNLEKPLSQMTKNKRPLMELSSHNGSTVKFCEHKLEGAISGEDNGLDKHCNIASDNVNEENQKRNSRSTYKATHALVSRLVAKALAAVMRGVSGAESEFLGCAYHLMRFFWRCPKEFLSLYRSCAAQMLFESVKGVKGNHASMFETLFCFLYTNSVLQKSHKVSEKNIVFDPSLSFSDSERRILSDDEAASASAISSNEDICTSEHIAFAYEAQLQCFFEFLQMAHKHGESMQSPGSILVQRLILSLLPVTLSACLVEESGIAEEREVGRDENTGKLFVETIAGGSVEAELWFHSSSLIFSTTEFVALTSLPIFVQSLRYFEVTGDRSSSEFSFLRSGACVLLDALSCFFFSSHRIPGNFDEFVDGIMVALTPLFTKQTNSGSRNRFPSFLRIFAGGMDVPISQKQALTSVWLAVAVLRLCTFMWRAVSSSFIKTISTYGNIWETMLTHLAVARRQCFKFRSAMTEKPYGIKMFRLIALLDAIHDGGFSSVLTLWEKPEPVNGFFQIGLRPFLSFLFESISQVELEEPFGVGFGSNCAFEGLSEHPMIYWSQLFLSCESWRGASGSLLVATILRSLASSEDQSLCGNGLQMAMLLLKGNIPRLWHYTNRTIRVLCDMLCGRGLGEDLGKSDGELYGNRRISRDDICRTYGVLQWITSVESVISKTGANINILFSDAIDEDVEAVVIALSDILNASLHLMCERTSNDAVNGEHGTIIQRKHKEDIIVLFIHIFKTFVAVRKHDKLKGSHLKSVQPSKLLVQRLAEEIEVPVEVHENEFYGKTGFVLQQEIRRKVAHIIKQEDDFYCSDKGMLMPWLWVLISALILNTGLTDKRNFGEVDECEGKNTVTRYALLSAIDEILRQQDVFHSDPYGGGAKSMQVCLHLAIPFLNSSNSKLRYIALSVISSCHKLTLCCAHCVHLPMMTTSSNGGDAFSLVLDQLAQLKKLEYLKSDLQTERQKCSLIAATAEGIEKLRAILSDDITHEETDRGNSVALSCKCGRPLPFVEISIRTLMAQFSVKFSSLWGKSTDAILSILKSEMATQGLTDLKLRGRTENAKDIKLFGIYAEIIVQQVERSVFEMPRMGRKINRKVGVVERIEERSVDICCKRELLSSGREYLTDCWVAEYEACSCNDESDPLVRHGSLLRLVEGILRIWPNEVQDACFLKAEQETDLLTFLIGYATQLESALAQAQVDEDMRARQLSHSRFKGRIGTCNVSIVPRLCDVFRALLSVETIRFETNLFGKNNISSVDGREDEICDANLNRNQGDVIDVSSADVSEFQAASLWRELLIRVSQRLIVVKDVTLQQLSFKVLLLSNEWKRFLKPYEPIILDAIKDQRGSSASLITLLLGSNAGQEFASVFEQDTSVKGKQWVDVVMHPLHRSIVLPVIVRILLSKAQTKLGRSSLSTIAMRKRIFGLLGRLAVKELPFLLSGIFLNIVLLTRIPTNDRVEVGSELGEHRVLGLEKERLLTIYLVREIEKTQKFLKSSVMSLEAVRWSEITEDTRNGSIQSDAVNLRIANWCYDPDNSGRLHGVLVTINSFVQTQKRMLQLAAPFIGSVLSQLLVGLIPADSDISDGEGHEEGGVLNESNGFTNNFTAIQPKSKGASLRHCIKAVLKTMHTLMEAFPELAPVWPIILRPASSALHRLLSTAIATGAGVAEGDSYKGKIPHIVRLVCSWTTYVEYFDLFRELLPNGLSILARAPSSPSLLGSIRKGITSSSPMLQLIVEAFIMLSFGGRTDEQIASEELVVKRQFFAAREYRLKRKREGYDTSDEDDPEADNDVEEDERLVEYRKMQEEATELRLKRTKAGLELLQPHIGTLIKSFHSLFLERRSSSKVPSTVYKASGGYIGNDSGFHASKKREEYSEGSAQWKLIVSVKELQLLDRIATACTEKTFGISLSVSLCSIRLLLMATPMRVKTATDANRLQLTFRAIQGLLINISAEVQCLYLSSEKSKDLALDEICTVLRKIVMEVYYHIQRVQDLQCRASASELLLAVELVACGCFVSRKKFLETFREYSMQLVSRIKDDDLGEKDDCITGAETLAPLLPDGQVLKTLLSGALPEGSLFTASNNHDKNHELRSWSVAAAAILVCLNYLKGGHARGGDERPDGDMHILVLQSFSALHIWAPSAARWRSSQTGNQLYPVPERCIEPLLRHCLFLLGECTEDLLLQQSAFGFIRKLMSAIGAAAAATATIEAALKAAGEQMSCAKSGQGLRDRDYARRLYDLLTRLILPFARNLLKASDEIKQLVAVRIIEIICRFLGPVLPFLVGICKSDGGNLTVQDEVAVRRVAQMLHLDLYWLVRLPSVGTEAQRAASLAQAAVQSGLVDDAGMYAASAAVIEASACEDYAREREGGGDLFLELTHLQIHRRVRGLQLLTKAVNEKKLGILTVTKVVVPLAISAVIQHGSSQTFFTKKRKTSKNVLPFNHSLAETAVSCLSACCQDLPWAFCIATINTLVKKIKLAPKRVAMIHRSIAGVVQSFEVRVRKAMAKAEGKNRLGILEINGVTLREDVSLGDQSEKQKCLGVTHSKEEKEPLAHGSLGIGDPNVGNGIDGQEFSETAEDCEGDILNEMNETLEDIQEGIRKRVLPLLMHLTFGAAKERENKVEKSQVTFEEKQPKPKATNLKLGMVAVVLSLIRMLPCAQFRAEMPNLIRRLSLSLKSKERSTRAQARQALVQTCRSLGAEHFSFIAYELCKQLGPRSEKDATAHLQSFYRPVLLFTLHAMLSAVATKSAEEWPYVSNTADKAMEQPGAETDLDNPHIRGFDKVTELLLPLVAEELNRITDNDKRVDGDSSMAKEGLSFIAASTAVDAPDGFKSKCPEARHLRGPSTIQMLSRFVSKICISRQMVPFFCGLLGGPGCKRFASNANIFSLQYINRVEDIMLHFAMGVNKNPLIDVQSKLRLSKQLLLLSTAYLQYGMLHPLLQQRWTPDKVIIALVQQQLLLELPREIGLNNSFPSMNFKNTETHDADSDSISYASKLVLEDMKYIRLFILGGACSVDDDSVESGTIRYGEYGSFSEGPRDQARRLLSTLLEVRKEGRIAVQPGAPTGRSLEQATTSRTVRNGVDFLVRSELIGTTAMRLLLLTLKENKIVLKHLLWGKERPNDVTHESLTATLSPGNDGNLLSNDAFMQLNGQLRAILFCFCSKRAKLAAWGSRCLLELVCYQLPQIKKNGPVIALTTLKAFQSVSQCGNGCTGTSSSSSLLPVYTKLMTLVLLRPESSTWLDHALSDSQSFSMNICRSMLQEQIKVCEQYLKAQNRSVGKSNNESRVCSEIKRSFASEPLDGNWMLLEDDSGELSRLQSAERFILKEALIAHISDSLDNPNLQICALLLFKRVILTQFRDTAAEILNDNRTESTDYSNTAAGKDESKGKHGKKAKSDTSAAALLPMVYKCVERIVQLMIRGASASAANDRMVGLCSDVYVSFLLNFPMTAQSQRNRILFVAQQFRFARPEGRKAAASAMLKILRRFPNELVLSRYAHVCLISTAAAMAQETEEGVYEVLHEVLLELLSISKNSECDGSSLHSLLEAAERVFLHRNTMQLLALLDVLIGVLELNIFFDGQVLTLKKPVLTLILRHLSMCINYNCPWEPSGEPMRNNFKLWSKGHEPSEGGLNDWRLEYKILRATEKVFFSTLGKGLQNAVFDMHEAFSSLRMENFERLRKELFHREYQKGEGSQTGNALHFEAESCLLKILYEQCTGISGIGRLVQGLDCSDSSRKEKWQEITGITGDNFVSSRGCQLSLGLSVVYLWIHACRGLKSDHPWIRASALRSVANFMTYACCELHQFTKRNLFECIPREEKGKQYTSGISVETFEAPTLSSMGRCLLRIFGRDPYLDIHPEAAPAACKALLAWSFGALALPNVFILQSGRNKYEYKIEQPHMPISCSDAPCEPSEWNEFRTISGNGTVRVKREPIEGCLEPSNIPSTVTPTDEAAKIIKDEDKGVRYDIHSDAKSQDKFDSDTECDVLREDHWAKDVSVVSTELLDSVLDSGLFDDGEREMLSKPKGQIKVMTEEDERLDLLIANDAIENISEHPINKLLRSMNHSLRVHLGKIGFKAYTQEEKNQNLSGTMVRIVAILTCYSGILSRLPINKSSNVITSDEMKEGRFKDCYKKCEKVDAIEDNRELITVMCSQILDGCYRCSTIHTETTDSLVLQLISASDGETAYSDANVANWEKLFHMSPKRQQQEIATAGAYIIRKYQTRMERFDLGDLFRSILASTIQNVAARRVLRKARYVQGALLDSQSHAKKIRKKNLAKVAKAKRKLLVRSLHRKKRKYNKK